MVYPPKQASKTIHRPVCLPSDPAYRIRCWEVKVGELRWILLHTYQENYKPLGKVLESSAHGQGLVRMFFLGIH